MKLSLTKESLHVLSSDVLDHVNGGAAPASSPNPKIASTAFPGQLAHPGRVGDPNVKVAHAGNIHAHLASSAQVRPQ